MKRLDSRHAMARGRRALVSTLLAGLVSMAGLAAPLEASADPSTRFSTAASSATTQQSLQPRKDPSIHIDPELGESLASGKPTRFVIEFKAKADLSAAYAMTGKDQWEARGQYVYQQLRQVAERSQADVRAHLQSSGRSFKPFWIMNVIVVEDGDQRLAQDLLTFSEISALRIYKPFDLIRPEPAAPAPRPELVESNIAWVEAPTVWANGYTGTGMVVATIDSGVRYTHEVLVNRYRGNLGGGSFEHDYNWFDPYDLSTSPNDSDSHGSHVTGTMVGSDATETNQTGIAPGAQWIACQGFNPSASDAGLLGCGQFIAAPTRVDGTDPDPARRPHAVNNSWGDCGQTYDNWYEGVIDAWIAAGIVPVFSNGNASNCGYSSPPGLNTVGNPARSKKVLGIGSTGTANGTYANHSNWGPTDDVTALTPGVHPDLMGFDQLKPNVVAPGVSIRSATNAADNSYALFTGTSMSSPHVTGLVALMWEAAPCLIGDYATTGTIIAQTARPIDYNSGGVPPPGPGNIPNYATGWGEIDALDAVDAAIAECGPQGFIAGTVTETGSGTPIADARIEIEDNVNSRTLVVFTDASGNYSRRVPEMLAGGHDVAVSRYGYIGENVTGVLVTEDQTTDVDFQLDLAPSFTVSGTVTDATTGWPLAARIDISGFPDGPVWSDPVTGAYSVDLVAAQDYGLTAEAILDGYNTDSDSLMALGANQVVDFQLDPDGATCAAPGYSPILFSSEDFEANDGGYTHAGTQDEWEWGAPITWPGACASGSSCWGTDLDGNYNNGANFSLESPVIDLSGVAGGTTLVARWQQALHIESSTWDDAYAEVSINGGPYAVMWEHTATSTTQTNWTQRSFDISAAAGTNVRFRFRLTSDSSLSYSGFYIDDVQVVGDGCNPPNGDLVLGTTRDANTGVGLNGVDISVDASTVMSSANADHPQLGDGFYALHVPLGPAATVAGDGSPVHPGYGSDSGQVTASGGATQLLDLDIPAGQLSFTPPGGPAATVALGGIDSVPLQVGNDGDLPANYALQGVALDAQFEAGVPPAGWSVTDDDGGGCVWTTNTAVGRPNFAGGDGISATADSDVCGDGTTMDTSLVTPRIDLSSTASASLSFVLSYRHLGTSAFEVDASADDGNSWSNLYSISATTSGQGPGTPVSLDLASLIGSSQARLRFRYVSPDWNWWAQIDQVQVFGDFGVVPWLALTPVPPSGTLAAGASDPLNAVFDAASLGQPGVYTSPIHVVHDTPYDVPDLPATLTVETPASYGTVSGTVAGLGRCDIGSAPLAGATVTLQGQSSVFQTTTDASGNFSWMMDSAESPITVLAGASGHIGAQLGGVMLSAGGAASANLDLRADLPCFDVSPGSIAATLEQNGADSRGVMLSNSGAGALSSWNVTVGGEPGIPISAFASETASQTPIAANTVTCNAGGLHADNGFFRVYDHADFGIAGPVPITEVQFTVESATAGSGGQQPVTVALFDLDGPLAFANMTLLASKDVMVPDGSLTTIDVPLDAPVVLSPGADVVVMLFLPDGQTAGHSLFPGSNSAGQTGPSYIAAPDCGANDPTDLASLGFPNVHIILNLSAEGAGTSCDNPTPVAWMVADPSSGAIAGDSSDGFDALLDATGLATGSYEASLCVSSSDAGAASFEIPVDLEVVEAAPVVDLGISLTDSVDPATAGDTVTYTVTVDNLGPGTTSSVQVLAQLPTGSSFIGTSAGAACIEAAGTLDCDFASPLASGGSLSFTVDMTAVVPGLETFTATVSSADSNDPDASNNEASETTTVVAAPTADLALSVNGPEGVVLAGTSAEYLVKVANLGGDPVTGVTVSLGWPADLSFAGSSGTGWSCVGAAGSATCTLGGSQASGFAPDLVVQLLVDAGSTGGTRTVDFSVASDEADGNLGNNAVSLDAEVEALPQGEAIFADGFED